jgi:hypothetical protein
MTPPSEICIQAETPGDSASLFRLLIDQKIVGESLTAAQAHLLVGEILGRVALPAQDKVPLDKPDASNDK